MNYPSRNECRCILEKAFNKFEEHCEVNKIPKNLLTSYLVLWYNKKHNIEFVTFEFTNALLDISKDSTMENENKIDTTIILNKNKRIEEIEEFIERNTGVIPEKLIIEALNNEEYRIILSYTDETKLDTEWFNNSDKFIHPLIISYKEMKEEKGMLFQNKDIKQITIDYSIVLCLNHYRQFGFISKEIVVEIIELMLEATNKVLSTEPIKTNEIEYAVFNDIQKSGCVKSAYKFIKQL